MAAADAVRILSVEGSPSLPIVEGQGSARAVVWTGTGARLRSMHLIELDPGAGTVPQSHEGEAVYAILDGSGSVRDDDDGTAQALETGSMAHIDAGTAYRFEAGDSGMKLVGGPAPVDETAYGHLAS